jgi:N-acyl-D-amino-acid deacylase
MSRTLLKNGRIIDGSGHSGYTGDVLVEGGRILCVSQTPLPIDDCKVIDCTDKAVAPGFIDAHSHYD